jgi:hypothetical protein
MLDKKKISRHIVAGLTIYAFGNSYLHGVSWVQDHSDGLDVFAWGTAAIPELILISTLLRGRFDLKAVVGGVASIGWTFWVNGAYAASGVSGMVVALAPALAAVFCAWLLESEEAPAPKPRPRTRPKTQDHKPKKPSFVDQGILWATQTYNPGEWPTTNDVIERFPHFSRSTAQKIVRARPVNIKA